MEPADGKRDEDDVQVLKSDGCLLENSVVTSFQHLEDAPFPEAIQKELKAAGFVKPTPIQQYAWPLALEGRDFIGLAKTGSGKTLAFLLPAFVRTLELDVKAAPVQILVLTPTRELACQIEGAARRFGKDLGIRPVAIYGGVAHAPQLRALETEKPRIIVACPGRLLDMLSWHQLDLSQVCVLVVDEADRLLDMGFEPQVREVLEYLPAERQSLLFSATWPKDVRELAADILHPDHVEIRVGQVHELTANQDVSQTVLILQDVQAKEKALLDHLHSLSADLFHRSASQRHQPAVADSDGEEAYKVLVFCTKRDSVDKVYDVLVDEGVRCAAIHSEHDQIEREHTMRQFRGGEVRVLVATDLVARGLDIMGVSLVVNFEPPHSYRSEDYVHRIGRTGRAGRRGQAVTFLSPKDANQARAIAEVMQRTGHMPGKELEALAAQAKGNAKQRRAVKRQVYLAGKSEEDQRKSRPRKVLSRLIGWAPDWLIFAVVCFLVAELCGVCRRQAWLMNSVEARWSSLADAALSVTRQTFKLCSPQLSENTSVSMPNDQAQSTDASLPG